MREGRARRCTFVQTFVLHIPRPHFTFARSCASNRLITFSTADKSKNPARGSDPGQQTRGDSGRSFAAHSTFAAWTVSSPVEPLLTVTPGGDCDSESSILLCSTLPCGCSAT